MQPIKFIHTADIHLGSPLKSIGSVSGQMQRRLRESTFTALERIVDAAIRYEVDFVLFAGDVFDLESRNIKASRYLVEQLQRLDDADINAYIIAGNHDPKDANRQEILALPGNTHLFGSEDVSVLEVQKDDSVVARVLGQSYRGQSDHRVMTTYYTVDDASVWNIGLLHTALDPNNKNYVPVDLDKLLEKTDIHYWALGHIHKQQLIRATDPVVVYPGNPQGRDVGESGLKGCLLVELVPDHKPTIQFVPTGSIVWKEETISIEDVSDELETIDDLIDYCIDCARDLIDQPMENPSDIPLITDWNQSELVEGYIIRWTITGRGEIHKILSENRIENANDITQQLRDRLAHITPFLWTESVNLETALPIPELETLAAESDIFADISDLFYQTTISEELYQEMLSMLGKIWDTKGDYESLDSKQFLADEETVNDLLEEAKRRVVEAIYEYRENQ